MSRTWHQAVEDYVNMRCSLGFKLAKAMATLLDFAVFLEDNRASHITIALAMRWAQQNPAARPVEWAQRLSLVRGFARHWSANDSETEIPPWRLLPHRPSRAWPYIYSDDEVQRLLAAAQQLPPAGSLRGSTYYCLLGLLSVTGLRISEARNLQSKDVDLEKGILTIRGTKFGKSRLVPIHASTKQVLSDYVSYRDHFLAGRPASHFFVSTRGTRLDGGQIRHTFYELSRQTGLRAASASHGPRIHDFRHRFALQSLVRWYRLDQDVECRLPILSTYLGHVHVADTYWYLTAYPELMGLAMKRLEKRWEGQS
jgi:integrase/recombinase XerD